MSLLAKLYGWVTALRNYLYDKGVFPVHDLGAFTVSIGNITSGGTGKTPMVAFVAGLLAERDEKVCVLTRGYGREDENRRVLVSDGCRVVAHCVAAGDEPVELAEKLLGKAIVIAEADRIAAAEWARRRFGVTAFVLDDGFQHRRAGRDLDIVCVDATNPFGGNATLPKGRLRESLGGLSRADIVVITRAEQVLDLSDLKKKLAELAPGAPVFESRTSIARLVALDGAEAISLQDPVFAFCGIGNPENFFNLLRHSDYALAGSRSFSDHHQYSQTEVTGLESAARGCGAGALVTTAKDSVKLRSMNFTIPCYVAEIDVEISDTDEFRSMLQRH